MRNTVLFFTLVLSIFSVLGYSAQHDDFPILKGPYFGQVAPLEKAEVFMDGIISTLKNPEMCAAFTQDGKEFYYNAFYQGNWNIFVTREINGKWEKPEPISFAAQYTDRDFTISPDGNKLYFGSNRPRKQSDEELMSLDIFVTERISPGRWSDPKNVGFPVNTDLGENYPSVASSGNLYFFSCRDDGWGGCDIYMSRFINGRYTTPENLGNTINSEKNDWDAVIAPDENYIIFSSQDRSDSIGGQDLYIAYRQADGSWTKAKNMGESVNSESAEICPSVSLDGKYFFFTSRRRGKADIFWMDAGIFEKFKPQSDFSEFKGPYFGQKPPGMTPEVFAPALLATSKHAFCSVFSPNGFEFYFVTDLGDDKTADIMWMRSKNDIWAQPTAAPFNSPYTDNDICISPDGNKVFFRSWRPLPGREKPEESSYIWFSIRTKQGWNQAQLVECGGSFFKAGYPSATSNGTLYFPHRSDKNVGESDIHYSRIVNGAYGPPVNLGSTINTKYIEGDMCVAPNESFLIVSCWHRPDHVGGGESDLYISFRDDNGEWSALKNMGKLINNEANENCPMLSPDGKYFFFFRYEPQADTSSTFWVDAKIIEDYKPDKIE